MSDKDPFRRGVHEPPLWQAEKRMLPPHLRGGDNSLRVAAYRQALRAAVETKLTRIQREQLMLFYCGKKTKTEIGRRYGVGSSTVCKTLKAAEKAIRDYVEAYMEIRERVRRDLTREDEEDCEIRGEIRQYAANKGKLKRYCQ